MKHLLIIIVNYNTGKLLANCIESIKKTTKNFTDPECEVIVVDNASTDDSMSFLKATGYKYKLKAISNKQNLGFARAVNQGIRKSKVKYKLLLNPDTVVKDEAIKKLLDFAKSQEDAGVVGARLLNPDGSFQKSVMHFPTIWRAIQEFWFGRKTYSKYAPTGSQPVIVDAVVGAAFLITPAALQKVGLLDERYFMYFEDLDYCRRVKNAGLKVYYLSDAEIIHYHGVSGRSLASQENQWKRLIPSSKIYHGTINHYLITFIILLAQKIQKIFRS